MQQKSLHKFFGLNTDDNPAILPDGDYTFAKNVRTQGSDAQHGAGPAETLQSEIPVKINPDALIIYYGDAIGNDFIYSGYEEKIIGTQTWMKKNYDFDYPGSKVYDDDEDNTDIYGRLYTHNQTMSADFCPVGWHVPTEAEWDALINYLLGEALSGGKLKNVGTALWVSPNTGADDESGFRAVPGGKFDAVFELLGFQGLLWLADDGCPLAPTLLNASEVTHESFKANWKASDGATGYRLDVSESPVFASFMMGYEDKDIGNVLFALVEDLEAFTTYYFRLRSYSEGCLSADSETGTTKTLSVLKDIDGNVYMAKTIGNQQWIDRNFKATHYSDGSDIPNITDNTEWANDIAGAFCWYANNIANKAIYGALYNWFVIAASTPMIILTTTKTGVFSITLAGGGDVVITWPDLTTQTVVLNGMGNVVITKALVGGGMITISNATVITLINCANQSLTTCVIPASCINIQSIILNINQLISFTTHKEWVALLDIEFYSNQLTSFTAYAEWTALQILVVGDNQLTTFIAYATWVNLTYFDVSQNQLTAFIAHAEWINLLEIYLNNNQLTAFIAYATWVNLNYIDLHSNQLTSFLVYIEMISLANLRMDDNALTESSVNALLILLDSLWGVGGPGGLGAIGKFDGGTNAAPTGLGITAYDSLLILKGIAMTCNGYPV